MEDAILQMTAEIVIAQITASPMPPDEVPSLIASVHAALKQTTGEGVQVEPEVVKPEGKTTARRSLSNPAHIISMIDGKPYKTLKRHIGLHGYTPESYRETFGLAPDYPMVAPEYSAARSQMAKNIGLGSKGRQTSGRRKKAS